MAFTMNGTKPISFDQSPNYNPKAFQYGGLYARPGYADETADRFAGLAAGAQGRSAPQVDYSHAAQGYSLGLQARGGQATAYGLMMSRAQGLTPSIAQMQAQRDMQQAAASQASAGASARGAAGLALAQQNAANNTATMQSSISGQAQINAANERLAAEHAAFGAASGIRAGDAALQAQQAHEAEYQAQLQAQQAGRNDAYSMGLYGHEANVRAMQQHGSIDQQHLLSGSEYNTQALQNQINQANANREFDYLKLGAGLVGGAVGAYGVSSLAAGAPAAAGVSTAAAGGGVEVGGGAVAGAGPGSYAGAGYGGAGFGAVDTGAGGAAGAAGAGGAAATPYAVASPIGADPTAPGANPDYGNPQNDGTKPYYGAQPMDPYSATPMPGSGGGNPDDPWHGGSGSDDRMKRGVTPLGLLSDDRAKLRATYLLGRVDGSSSARSGEAAPYAIGSPLAPSEELVVHDGSPEIRRIDPRSQHLAEAIGAQLPAVQQRPTAGMFDREAQYQAAPRQHPQAPPSIGSPFERDAQYGGPRPAGHHYTDPVTDQFATGLSPIRFEYRPGMGPPGEQTGVRAQAAAAQPVTSSMVTTRPDGLLQIDPRMGLSTALAGVGHLAQKQAQQDRLLGLLAHSARQEGY